MEITIKTEYGQEVKVILSKDADLNQVLESIKGMLLTIGYAYDSIKERISTE